MSAAEIAGGRIMVLLAAAAVDLLVGDPHGLWHPVQGIGALITVSEKWFRKLFRVPYPAAEDRSGRRGNPQLRERAAGTCMVFFVLAACVGAVFAGLILIGTADPFRRGACSPLRILAEGILCGRLLALRSLGEAGFSVRDPLMAGDVEGARKAVSMIVGRDTDRMDEAGIIRAAVETVAENTSDGVTAPLFYMVLGGAAGGIFYKAVNTMDSMTGYKNDRYRFFGTAAARLDDLMNFIPSRMTALLMILSCLLPFRGEAAGEDGCGETGGGKSPCLPDAREAYRIWKRDRLKSASPNSAQTESVCAGALRLRLLGDTWYFGQLHRKREIGDGERGIRTEDITRSVILMRRSSVLFFGLGILILCIAGEVWVRFL